jgi:cytochrome d ubiquinol oxidase subunit II
VLAGAVILFPSLALLFRLFLAGRLDQAPATARAAPAVGGALALSAPGLLARFAVALLVAGFGLLTVADAAWAHAIGVAALLGFIVVGFLAIVPSSLGAGQRGHPEA